MAWIWLRVPARSDLAIRLRVESCSPIGMCVCAHKGRANPGNAVAESARKVRRVSMTLILIRQPAVSNQCGISSCAEPWAAEEQLNDRQQKKLSGNGSAQINADVDR